MSDATYLVLVVAFFLVAAGLLRACERVIGDDQPGEAADAAPVDPPAEAQLPTGVPTS